MLHKEHALLCCTLFHLLQQMARPILCHRGGLEVSTEWVLDAPASILDPAILGEVSLMCWELFIASLRIPRACAEFEALCADPPALWEAAGLMPVPPVLEAATISVLKSGLVRFFASKWGNRNCNRLHTYPDIDEPQPDCLEPVQYSSWIEKNQFKPVFCRNFYYANITYRFLNKYYPDHLIVI